MTLRSAPLLATALATALLAACAPESPATAGPSADAAAAPAMAEGTLDARQAAMASAGQQPGSRLATLPAGRTADAIAAHPNRGDLVGYDSVRVAERRGAHTFHPARVSEAHALDAIGTGTLFMTGPDGRRVELQYERHVEHPSGDWSWIGRDEHGVEGILTFGDQAVFGVMPYGEGETLRLTTNAGQTWMATTDRNVLSPMQRRINAGLTGPDFRIPQLDDEDDVSAAALVSAATASAAARAVGAAGAPAQAATGGTTVDVLLGYTAGFVSMMGGASQAQTRLNHIVTVGNQAFSNSSVAVNLRLVGTLQVGHTDAGSNQTALEQLTGSNGQSSVPVPGSLQPLRAARETLGADLVALVRRFRDADHDGCGIAWLVGGGQNPITPPYERFGYSVVSDSNGMQSPDNGHFCRDETLVHEIGHNMGSQHDREAATEDGQLSYGRYPYSFGHKTNAANGNFYTVMAYGDTGQTAYRIFSNPQSTYCGGRACGVANQNDNARSLRQTAPLIAAFRASIGGGQARTDINGDGRSDIIWRNVGSGMNAAWLGASSATQQVVATANLAWKLVGVDDFTGDGRADLVWRNETTGQNLIWPQGNVSAGSLLASVPGAAWQVVGTGDFDGDGFADLLWRNAGNGQNRIWRSGNAATMLPVANVPNLAWTVAGVGDIDGDGRADIVWRNTSNGQNTVWRSGNQGAGIVVTTVPDQAWRIVAVDDFDGDGRADLLWRKSSTGDNVIWRSGNNATAITVSRVPSQAWIVAGSGDYDGDGSADILWRNTSTGANTIWRSANLATQLSVATVPDQNWRVVP